MVKAENPGSGTGKLIVSAPSGPPREFDLALGQFTIGRGANSDIIIHDDWVSRSHARLEVTEHGFHLVDLDSANGTIVNSKRILEAQLVPGDIVTLGGTTIQLRSGDVKHLPEQVILDTEAEVYATISGSAVPIALNDTSLPRLALRTPSHTWEVGLDKGELTIGRQADNDIQLEGGKVSRRHALVMRHGNDFVLRDLNSANGTYMANERITERVLRPGDTFSIGGTEVVFKPGFTSADLTLTEEPPDSRHRGRRPVVFVPGMMGSELWRGSEKIWPNPQLMFTNPEIVLLPDRYRLEPRGIVREVVIVPNLIKQEQYSAFGDFFEQDLGYERGKDFLDFPYDWRQDVRESARQLASVIEEWNVRQPITLIAHSLGSLVARYYVEQLGGKKKIGRLILMGGPHQGTPKSLVNLVLGPNFLPFGLLGERLRRVLMTFPATYQILPTYPCTVDQHGNQLNLFEDELWATDEQRSLVRMARQFRRELGTRSSISTLSIFGYGHKTVTGLNVLRDTDGQWQKLEMEVQQEGDATIPQRSAILEQSEIHPVHQNHGALFLDNDVKMRLKLELFDFASPSEAL